MTVGERLAWAVERNGMSVSALHRAMQAHKVPSGSYGAAWNFVNGKQEPPLSWLIAAAEVLGVRDRWLVLGEGAPTKAEEAAHRAREDYDYEDEASVFKRELLRPFGEAAAAFAESAPASLFDVWTEILGDRDPYEVRDSSGLTEGVVVAARVASAVLDPLVTLGRTTGEQLYHDLDTYVIEVAQALKRYLSAERRARVAIRRMADREGGREEGARRFVEIEKQRAARLRRQAEHAQDLGRETIVVDKGPCRRVRSPEGVEQWETSAKGLAGPVKPLEFEHRGHMIRIEPRDGAVWAFIGDEQIELDGVRPDGLIDIMTEGYHRAVSWLDGKIAEEQREKK